MGVKHVEQIKAFILLLLVSLSLVLTFLIWTYTPDYQIIEDPQGEKVKLGKEKELYKVIKPYRILAHENNSLVGTIKSIEIDQVMETLNSINATDLEPIPGNITEEYFNKTIHSENHMTLFFPAEVPLATFSSILEYPQNEPINGTFSHLVINWDALDITGKLRLFFLSEENRTLYTANAKIGRGQFALSFMEVIQNSMPYTEIERKGEFSLYLPENPVELAEYTYIVEELPLETIEEILFKDTNIVDKSIVSKNLTKYQDGMAMMTANSNNKTIDYVYPDGNISVTNESDLLQDSIDFLNDHGGLTGDYRYAFSNVQEHELQYQLFMHDLPVFSENKNESTRIMTRWGDYQIFQYKRPYYIFDFPLPDNNMKLLPASDIIDRIPDLEDVDEILLGYYLKRDPDKPLYTLEPSWFVIRDGNWSRITPETWGGKEYGLE